MFVGTYTPKLDDKGRLVLPAKFREELEKGLMITRGQDHCLTIHRLEDFVALNRRLQEASLTNKRVRSYVRVLHSGAYREFPDSQGRITIPPVLRDYASLTKEVVVIGSMSQVEVWEPQRWATYLAEQEQEFADLGEEIFPGI
ncbi:MAG TPA: division/cell wall cluster transcriptional repressor MraZ [Nocardioides sp.]|uniref:division/cell wall cluster transcriptional repressor MraZ n=1 Tax=Nocardioides sp. TaxID=35761 RepID=UPI002C28861E|nr:division/cell wall cluster transcriptional repressor MraZ [Nocardioides sp.]HQR25783.1 division/cell wall cluster transcriptional repressor MraZ [Nocardioides sp.]